MQLVSLTSCHVLFISASASDVTVNLAEKFNALIAASSSGTYSGGSNPGVIVRSPDFFDGASQVEPATLWHNDIYAPSMMYPTIASPWCPNKGFDGVFSQPACHDDPWHFAIVGAVMADSMKQMWDDFDSIQKDGWMNGVFYATDANAVDQRCIYRDDWSGWDCPGAFIDSNGNAYADTGKAGSGAYQAGNPDVKGTTNGGGGSGCHYSADMLAMDQTDAYDADGDNLVQDYNCQCNYKYSGRWYDWVNSWTWHSQQKPGFEDRNWLDGSGRLAPSWGLDTAACWLNNPRDMIDLQNAIYWQRTSWSNQLIPETNWDSQMTSFLRRYWGWNEIPVATSIVNDISNWDAVVIKLPADACQSGDYGVKDDPSCLWDDAQLTLESDLDQFLNAGKLLLGANQINSRPGSAIVFAREFGTPWSSGGDSGVNWSREFFCTNWVSPNKKYKVVSTKNGACYIDKAGTSPAPSPAPSPDPSPHPSPAPSPTQGGVIRNQQIGLCLSLDGKAPSNGVSVTVGLCEPGWALDGDKITFAGKCLDATDMKQGSDNLILWECNGLDQQKWKLDEAHGSIALANGNGKCLDLWWQSTASFGVQLWKCNGKNNQSWDVSTAAEVMI